MAYTGTATITGVAGAGETVTAAVFTGITDYTFDIANQIHRFTDSDGRIQEIAVSTTLTVTVTVSSGNYTISVS